MSDNIKPEDYIVPQAADPDPVPVTETVSAPTVENLDIDEVEQPSPVVEKPTEAVESVVAVVQQNVYQEYDHSKAVTNFSDSLETVPLPSDKLDKVNDALRNADKTKLDDSEKTQEWAEVLSEGQDRGAYNNAFNSTLENPDAEFHQQIKTSSAVLEAYSPGFKAVTNEVLSGERASLRVMHSLGIGKIFRFPLYNSGLWLTLKPPSESVLLELNRLIVSDKIELGRRQYGLLFNNLSAVTTDRLVSLALEQVYQTNLNNPDNVDLRTLISSNDIPTLLWGLINTIYPNGFQYQRSCIADPEKCQHVISERINLSKLQWTNRRGLTDWQLSHMSKMAKGSIDIASVKRYKDELLSQQNREITLSTMTGGTINLVLRVPTVSEYIESGHRWIGDVTAMVNKALSLDTNNNERNRFIVNQGQSTALRQYLHWVAEVKLNNGEEGFSIIKDRETLEIVFNDVSADDEIRNGFMKEIAKYIDDSTITVIGIPVFDCPACGGENKAPKIFPKLTNIIPIDVQQTFFTLLVQKIQRIVIR